MIHYYCSLKNMLKYLDILNLKKFLMADRKFRSKFGYTVIMNCFSLKAKTWMPQNHSISKNVLP